MVCVPRLRKSFKGQVLYMPKPCGVAAAKSWQSASKRASMMLMGLVDDMECRAKCIRPQRDCALRMVSRWMWMWLRMRFSGGTMIRWTHRRHVLALTNTPYLVVLTPFPAESKVERIEEDAHHGGRSGSREDRMQCSRYTF